MILLTSNGHEVLLDAEDYERFSDRSWIAINKSGVWYACRTTYAGGGRANRKTKRLYLHRQIMGEPSGQVDHLDGNGLNNLRSNLRSVSNSENQRNRAGAQSNSTSGIRGVFWHKQRKKWAASLRLNGRQISLGLYADIADAVKARKEGERKYWSESDQFRVSPPRRAL